MSLNPAGGTTIGADVKVITGLPTNPIAITADATTGVCRIVVTGVASKNIRWAATVETTEVTY